MRNEAYLCTPRYKYIEFYIYQKKVFLIKKISVMKKILLSKKIFFTQNECSVRCLKIRSESRFWYFGRIILVHHEQCPAQTKILASRTKGTELISFFVKKNVSYNLWQRYQNKSQRYQNMMNDHRLFTRSTFIGLPGKKYPRTYATNIGLYRW